MWYVYICDKNGQLYTGITTDLKHRLRQHKTSLLYSESHNNKNDAAKRERQIKGWRREKKLAIIQKFKVSLPWAKPKGVRAGEPTSKGPIEKIGPFYFKVR